MLPPRPHPLPRILSLIAAATTLQAAQAMQVEFFTQGGNQSTSTQVFHGISGGPTHPPITTSGVVQQYQVITPGTQAPTPPFNNAYQGGTGVASESTVQGPALFYPDVVQPFQGHAWAVASSYSGQLSTQAHGTSIEQFRLLPQPDGSRKPQVDTVWALGSSQARTTDAWSFNLSRDAAAQLASRPVTFGLNLAIDTQFVANALNSSTFNNGPSPLGKSTLDVTIRVNRLINGSGINVPDTLTDGRPASISQTYRFEWDEFAQGPQTLRLEQTLDTLSEIWSTTSSSLTLDGSSDLQRRTCLDFRPGLWLDGYCQAGSVVVDLKLNTSSAYHLASASVLATWDATIDGSTDGILTASTTAAYWGQALNPLLSSRPSLATPVPEAGVWWMVLAGLGVVAWRRHVACLLQPYQSFVDRSKG